MGEQVYHVDGVNIQFAEDSDWRCLCTFPGNDGGHLDPSRVRSLALLGAAVVLAHDWQLKHGFLPFCVPEWIREGIIAAAPEVDSHVPPRDGLPDDEDATWDDLPRFCTKCQRRLQLVRPGKFQCGYCE